MSIVNLNIPSEVSQTITDGVTDKAPSENAVYDALGLLVPKTTTISHNGVELPLSGDVAFRSGLSNTGALSYLGISVASATTINVGAVKGIVSDNETDPEVPTYTMIDYAGELNVTVPTIGTGTATYVLLKKGVVTNGIGAGELFFQNTYPTSEERKAFIYLSKISHPSLAAISFALDEPDFVTSPLAQLRDWVAFIQYMKTGMDVTGNAGLTVNLTAGQVAGNGINFVANPSEPTYLPVPLQSPLQFFLQNQSGAVPSITSTIDPLNYDVGGVTTAIGGGTNRSTIQYLRYAPGVGFSLQRGQTIYSSLTDAIAAVGRESFVVRPNLVNNSILVAVICLRHTTTNMNDTAYVRILPADKFGQIGGAAAGISVTTIQSAYNNSVIPQLLVDATHGAYTNRSGMALNTDIIEQWQNIAGTTTASINGNGMLTASAITNTSMTLGSVLFAGTGGLVSQDNTNFVWDNTNKRLGVGINTPSTTIHALSTTTQLRLSYNSGNNYDFIVNSNGNLIMNGTTNQTAITDIRVGNNFTTSPRIFAYTTNPGTPSASGNNISFYNYQTSGDSSAGAWVFTGTGFSIPATNNIAVRINMNFTASGGTSSYSSFVVDPTINQIGGANGITRGVYVNLNPLSVAADWRSGEFINGTTGKFLIANATGVTPLASLHVRGSGSTGATNAFRTENSSGTSILVQDNSGVSSFNGDIKLITAGNGIYVKEGTNATMGVATMIAGTVTVNTTKVTANSRIRLDIQSLGTVATPKAIGVTARTAGTSFVITSADATDTSVVSWWIIEPA